MTEIRYEIERWRGYAEQLGFPKTEDAEKDYLQELLLYWLFTGKLSGLLVFRGGTAISKIYGSGRFSEDLDFIAGRDAGSASIKPEIGRAVKKFSLSYQTEPRPEEYRNMLKYTIKIKGPLYLISHSGQARQTVGIDVNIYERPMLATRQINRVPIYEDLQPYILNVASPEELLADKVKALLERAAPVARDLYDAWLLSKKYGLRPDLALVDRKMREYGKAEGERFSAETLRSRIKRIEAIWRSELSRLVRTVPDYSTVADEFLNSIS